MSALLPLFKRFVDQLLREAKFVLRHSFALREGQDRAVEAPLHETSQTHLIF